MNITREDAKQLPYDDVDIIATLYEVTCWTNLKTGESHTHENVYLAHGYHSLSNWNDFVFHYRECIRGHAFVQESDIGINGYNETLENESNIEEIDDKWQYYHLMVVVDFIMLDSVRIEATSSGKGTEPSPKIEAKYKTIDGMILWGFADEYETNQEEMER